MKIKKDTLFLFSIDNEELKKERIFSLLILRVGFILYSLFFSLLLVVYLFLAFVSSIPFQISDFGVIAFFIIVGILWRGMWVIMLLVCLALFGLIFISIFFSLSISSLFFSLLIVVIKFSLAFVSPVSDFGVISFFILVGILWPGMWGIQLWAYFALFGLSCISIFIHPVFSSSTLWFLFSLVMLIPAWRVRSFLKEQNKKLTAQDIQNQVDTSLIEQSPESFIEQ